MWRFGPAEVGSGGSAAERVGKGGMQKERSEILYRLFAFSIKPPCH